jgi:hypothetical protein
VSRAAHLAVTLLILTGCPTRREAPGEVIANISTSPAAVTPSAPAPGPSIESPAVITPPSKGVTVRSYSQSYASNTRASRVDTAFSRPLKALARVAELREAPLSVTLNEPADHVAVARAETYDILTVDGKRVYEETHRQGFSDIIMLADGFIQGYSVHEWNGVERPDSISADGKLVWALQYDMPTRWGAITSFRPAPIHPLDATLTPARTGIVSGGFIGSFAMMRWHEMLDGSGCGAISQDRRFAVAMRDGRFLVYDGNATVLDAKNNEAPPRTLTTNTAIVAYDLSIVPSGYALIEVGSPLPDPRPYSDLERALVLQARRLEFLTVPPPRWKTVVHHLDLQGKETWHAEVPFEVLQPPIDGSSGRVYLMGMGAAAFQEGKLLFSTPSPVPMLGTAFQDGTLAVAVGPELRIVGRDGQIRQRFTTAEHEAITTPPAIGSDGSVWVGTGKGLYVAR